MPEYSESRSIGKTAAPFADEILRYPLESGNPDHPRTQCAFRFKKMDYTEHADSPMEGEKVWKGVGGGVGGGVLGKEKKEREKEKGEKV